MTWPGKSILVLVALPIFTVCAATIYHFYEREKKWKKYQVAQEYEIEIKIPFSTIGHIIGRGGTNLKELQEKTNTKINFLQEACEEKDKICKIVGAKENVEAAKALILETISPKDQQVLEMWVPQYAVGKLIGRCGDNIRNLSRSFNTSIKVDRTSKGNRKLITIKGKTNDVAATKECVDKLVKEMTAQITQSTPRSPRTIPKFHKENEEFAYKVPQFEKLIGTTNDSMIQVYVSSVASPSNFWLQLITLNAVELDHLVDNMTEYYNKEENQKIHRLKEVREGQYVASKFEHDEKWYRVEVFSIEMNESDPDDSKVDIFYLDYGDSSFRRLGDLLELKPEYLNLKFQAIESSLDGILPKDGEWSEAATEVFEDMVYSAQWKVMLAQIVMHKRTDTTTRREMIPHVRLYDPDGTPGVDIGTHLIEKGFAIRKESDEDKPVDEEDSQLEIY